MNNNSFFREKFDVMLIAFLFLVSFSCLLANRNPDVQNALKDITQAFIYALLALVGVRGVRNAAVGSATTESGDIITQPPAADPPKEKLQSELPND